MNQKQVWNKIGKDWTAFREKRIKDVENFLKKQKGKILDLGCGSGRHFIKNNYLEFYGVDFSEEMLKFAKEKKIAKELKVASADEIPYENNFFDAGIFIATLHCISEAEKREKALKEFFRVLKPGAKAMIAVWSRNQKRIKNKPKEALIPWTVDGKKYFRTCYIYEKDELKKLLEKVGFNVLKIDEADNIVAVIKK